jgi:hypothetical protein
MLRMVCFMLASASVLHACSSGGADPDPGMFPATPDPNERTDCVTTRPAAGEVLAKHLTCEQELLQGTVAMGRVARDVLIENAVARFVIRGQDGAATFLGAGAGGVVDASPPGGVDVLKDLLPLANFSTIRPTAVVVTEAGGERAVVRVLVEMEVVGLVAAVVPIAQPARVYGAVDYELRPDDPVLRVTVHFTPVDGVESERFVPGYAAVVGGNADLLQPGEAGVHMMLEGPESATYVRMRAAGSIAVIASINLMQGSERFEAVEGEVVSFELLLAVGPTAADAWNAAHAEEAGLAELTVTGAAGDRVEVRQLDGTVMFRTRLDGDGRAVVRLEPGSYRAVAGFDEWFPGDGVDVTLGASGATADVGPAPSGVLHVDATAGGEDRAPVRVTVQHQSGGELTRAVAIGPTDLRLPPGDYTVTLSRGPEFDIYQDDTVVLADGATESITGVNLARVVDTTGWVAGDYHLHSEMSTDSRHWLPSAVRMLAAEGLEVAAATDHDFITDYDRYAGLAGTSGWVLMIPGSEVSHPILAHVNGYPLTADANQSVHGSPPWFLSGPADWFAALRERADLSMDPEGAIVSINHPRRSSSAWFNSIDLDRDTGLATVTAGALGLDPTIDLNDFNVEAIEVWNRNPESAGGANEETLADYLALYTLGHRFAMLGNSDSHTAGAQAGSVRTYVKVPNDTRGSFSWEDVAAGMRAREVTVSAGIFVTAEIVSVDTGTDTATVEVNVQAPPWVEVQRLRVYAGREEPYDEPLVGTGVVQVEVPLMGAGFVVVRVDGGRGDPVLRHSTMGITNPIHVP